MKRKIESFSALDIVKKNFFLLVLAGVFSFIFFYRLDYSTLVSWDEAWYGSIAREMVRTGDFVNMMWNGKPYYDHPPMGFWLIATSYKILGVNEFSTRLPSAVLGLFSILIVYKTSLELYGKKTLAFVTALILGTCVWYVIRVRSGNLDSTFVFFYILTVYLSVKSSKDFRWFPFTMVAFGGLILSKTLVGVSALILVLFFNWQNLLKIKKNGVYLALALLGFIALVLPWYYLEKKAYPDFIEHHFLNIGTRNKTLSSYFHLMLDQPLFYLHMGVRKWYYIWLASAGFLLVSFKFFRKNIFFLFLWNIIILYPFLTARETELWHLIPTYLPLAFIIAVGVYEIGILLFKTVTKVTFFKKIIPSFLLAPKIVDIGYILMFVYIALVQINIFYPEVFPGSKWVPDDVAISKAAAEYGKPIFLDDDYIPIAVFYSGKKVQPLAYMSDDKKTLEKFIQSDEANFVVITRNWVVDDLKKKNIPYALLEKNNSFSILTKP